MPRQSQSDIEIVGDVEWSQLMEQSAPRRLPLTDEMRANGWKTYKDLMLMWRRSETATRRWCSRMVEKGEMERRDSKRGCHIIIVYRPKPKRR